EALALVDAIPPLHGERGRPRRRPDCVLGDRGYDAAAIRRGLRARHIVPWLAMRRTKHGSGLGRWRWVVERTFAWLSQFRRLRVRYDRRADIHDALQFSATRTRNGPSRRADLTVRVRPADGFGQPASRSMPIRSFTACRHSSGMSVKAFKLRHCVPSFRSRWLGYRKSRPVERTTRDRRLVTRIQSPLTT